MRISLIVAMTQDRVIGRQGDLPWRLSDDLRRFKRLTMGHTIVMGRKTYESIGRPLPGRKTVVISGRTNYRPGGVSVAGSLSDAIALAIDETELFVIGGGQIYQLALPCADRIYLTQVQAPIEGDTYFPEWNQAEWNLVSSESTAADDRNEHPTLFQIWDR